MKEHLFHIESKALADIVNQYYNVDIMKKYRGAKFVEARMMYAKILYERGYTWTAIGKSINKHHATVIHYNELFDNLSITDKQLRERHSNIVALFLDVTKLASLTVEESFNHKITSLKLQVAQLTFDNQSLERRLRSTRRISRIIDVIDERTPIGQEREVERRINTLFNKIQHELK